MLMYSVTQWLPSLLERLVTLNMLWSNCAIWSPNVCSQNYFPLGRHLLEKHLHWKIQLRKWNPFNPYLSIRVPPPPTTGNIKLRTITKALNTMHYCSPMRITPCKTMLAMKAMPCNIDVGVHNTIQCVSMVVFAIQFTMPVSSHRKQKHILPIADVAQQCHSIRHVDQIPLSLQAHYCAMCLWCLALLIIIISEAALLSF